MYNTKISEFGLGMAMGLLISIILIFISPILENIIREKKDGL